MKSERMEQVLGRCKRSVDSRQFIVESPDVGRRESEGSGSDSQLLIVNCQLRLRRTTRSIGLDGLRRSLPGPLPA